MKSIDLKIALTMIAAAVIPGAIFRDIILALWMGGGAYIGICLAEIALFLMRSAK